ncbi:MAG: type VI secretion system lipoprotein TssJ [Deltaproteobacteria bacterium]|nr:type VI secretion system lipoprotein TssJ [Deltaproteobacteria bacterium]MBM4348055.1 type VI secretion system lipoprotein TssJ [Deltaproteobacteria bacterium]
MMPTGGKTMKNHRILACLLLSILFLSSCATVVVPPRWEYEPNAIRLNIKSDPQLNLFQGRAHTLVLCAYLLTDPNELNQLIDEKGGLEKLCECTKFHPSVTHAKRFIIHPNREYKETLDRAAGAKYVAVVAGYFTLKKENVVKLFPIPVVDEKKGNTLYQKPGVLTIDLLLGSQQIQEVKGK